ncbi:MAG: hypothetical protein C4K49_12920 [Candidatus Thorarchaeota archaeon]|nr:MAG: hypothetical protein C4K49_12920 [Candidatus Thorarchaeota archaeon]
MENASKVGLGDTEMSEELTDTLTGIVVTQEGKKPQRELEFVTDEKKASVLLEPVRRHIVNVLRKGIDDEVTSEEFNKETSERIIRKRAVKRYTMSVVEIVKASTCDKSAQGFTKNQVYHHLPTLIEAGFVIKYGTVTTGKRTTDYYRRTARGFVIAVKPAAKDEKVVRKEVSEKIGRILSTFQLDVQDDRKQELVDLATRLSVMETSWRAKIGKLVRDDIADPDIIDIFASLVDIYGEGSEEYRNLKLRMREILFPSG